ncbi:hypothetical protein HanOQP8_Chr17g0667071 [Helianthus annuus]|nr:hypothetical protein HanIR_Chr17g0881211 [Helianthus annuus]KAJ0636871.1 hypothetical protein HanOQP8_Chr17g0667071 [Helianthus annuus]KAJ0813920.1 hypothetical protein HanPSC8_Chr17g0779261 [Helianthus annuus]
MLGCPFLQLYVLGWGCLQLRPSFHVSRGVKRCWFLGPLLPGLHFAVDREE